MSKYNKGLGVKTSASIHVRLGAALIEELDALAAAAGKTRADLMRDALAGHCESSKVLDQMDSNHVTTIAMLEAHERRAISEKLQRDEESNCLYEAVQELHKILKNQETKR